VAIEIRLPSGVEQVMRKLREFSHAEQVKDLLPTGERAEIAKCALEATIPANSNDIV
jgi:hypothetical protein